MVDWWMIETRTQDRGPKSTVHPGFSKESAVGSQICIVARVGWRGRRYGLDWNVNMSCTCFFVLLSFCLFVFLQEWDGEEGDMDWIGM